MVGVCWFPYLTYLVEQSHFACVTEKILNVADGSSDSGIEGMADSFKWGREWVQDAWGMKRVKGSVSVRYPYHTRVPAKARYSYLI